MSGEARERVEPVECGAGHHAVEMYAREETGSEVEYACPTCGRVILLDFFGSEINRTLVEEGEFS
jgi:predicted RNA-binding Zn-ribbon protein involved in translation (DUF1610 family)